MMLHHVGEAGHINVVSHGAKLYRSTTGPYGKRCWVSYSGDDEVAVIDYDSEKEVARFPVGDHPQRIRARAIQKAYLAAAPDGAADEPDNEETTAEPGDKKDSKPAKNGSAGSAAGTAATGGPGAGAGSLPFTGLELALIGLSGSALVLAGLGLRHRLAADAG